MGWGSFRALIPPSLARPGAAYQPAFLGRVLYQIAPSRKLSVFARGFIMLIDIAMDQQGNLYVLDTSTGHLDGPPFTRPHCGRVRRIDARSCFCELLQYIRYMRRCYGHKEPQ